MSFESLIAHNGVSHQKSSPAEKPEQSTTEAQHEDIKQHSSDSQITPSSNHTFEKQVLETPETKIDTKPETLTTTESDLDAATLVPGFGESIFILLIASPFLLLGFKKWLHK